MTKLSNKELIENAFKQIEQETGFHIIDKKYLDGYFVFTGSKDSVCHFRIKEIPRFLFGVWTIDHFDNIKEQINEGKTTWADIYRIDSKSDLVFFAQYERELDKFKPSRSGFVAGAYRIAYESNFNSDEIRYIEEWEMRELIDILRYMKKHPIKSYYYVMNQINYIWDSVSGLAILREFIRDWFGYHKHSLKKKIKLNKTIRKSLKLAKKIKNSFVSIEDYGENWYPRIHIHLRKRDILNLDMYNKEQTLIDEFEEEYWNDVSISQWDYDPNKELTVREEKNDEIYKTKFFARKIKEEKILYRNW